MDYLFNIFFLILLIRTFEEAEKIADLIDDNKPKLFVRKDVIMDIKTYVNIKI